VCNLRALATLFIGGYLLGRYAGGAPGIWLGHDRNRDGSGRNHHGSGGMTISALVGTGDTRLGRSIAPHAADNPGKTGIHALPEPREAFTARVVLAAAADRSLDVQY